MYFCSNHCRLNGGGIIVFLLEQQNGTHHPCAAHCITNLPRGSIILAFYTQKPTCDRQLATFKYCNSYRDLFKKLMPLLEALCSVAEIPGLLFLLFASSWRCGWRCAFSFFTHCYLSDNFAYAPYRPIACEHHLVLHCVVKTGLWCCVSLQCSIFLCEAAENHLAITNVRMTRIFPARSA